MSAFSASEIAYLTSQRLGRLATVGAYGRPHVVPVAFSYNAELDTIDIGGHGVSKSKKYRDAQRNPAVAFVVDDLASTSPWVARGVEIRGDAHTLPTGGEAIGPGFDPEVIRITPHRVVSWGLPREEPR